MQCLGTELFIHVVGAVEQDDDIRGVGAAVGDGAGQNACQHHTDQQEAQETFSHGDSSLSSSKMFPGRAGDARRLWTLIRYHKMRKLATAFCRKKGNTRFFFQPIYGGLQK